MYISYSGKELRSFVASGHERITKNDGFTRHCERESAQEGEREFVYKKIVFGLS